MSVDIYGNVRQLCDKKNISVSALEAKAGLGTGTISKWKTVSPTIATLQAVADALGVKLTRLLRDKHG